MLALTGPSTASSFSRYCFIESKNSFISFALSKLELRVLVSSGYQFHWFLIQWLSYEGNKKTFLHNIHRNQEKLHFKGIYLVKHSFPGLRYICFASTVTFMWTARSDRVKLGVFLDFSVFLLAKSVMFARARLLVDDRCQAGQTFRVATG